MPVIRTDRWLGEWHDDPVRLCRHLVLYFPDANERDIYFHLVRYGMYKPSKNMKETIKQMKQKIYGNGSRRFTKRERRNGTAQMCLFFFFQRILITGF